MVKWSGELLDFKSVYSTVLQDVYTSRLKRAMDRYIQGDSYGKRSGRPRYKTAANYRSFNFPQVKQEWIDTKNAVLHLPFIGGVQIQLHRPLPDGFKLKTVQVIKKSDGWYANLCIEDPTVPEFTPDKIIPTWDNSVGMDAVLYEEDFLALSDGQKLPSLKSFRKTQSKLAAVSKRKSERKKGSNRRRKLAKREARIHQRIARSRKDHAFKTAHTVVRTGKKFFFHEDLNLKSLTKRNKAKTDETGRFLPNNQNAKSGLNKSWLDAEEWKLFPNLGIHSQASAVGGFPAVGDWRAKAGAKAVAVNPSYTSQFLSYRDKKVFTNSEVREYWDEIEQLLVDRDINASLNVKRVGLGLFLTINSRSGKVKVSHTHSTAKEVLRSLRGFEKPTLTA